MVVHRQLTAALQVEQEAEPARRLEGNKDLEELAEHINARNRVRTGDWIHGSTVLPSLNDLCGTHRRPSEPRTSPSHCFSISSSENGILRPTRAAWLIASYMPSETMVSWSSFQSKQPA